MQFNLEFVSFPGSAVNSQILRCMIPATLISEDSVVQAVSWLCAGKCCGSTKVIFLFLFIFSFLNYILFIMLLQLWQVISLCCPPPSTPHSLRQSPCLCSCPWVMRISSSATPFPVLYCTSPWLFCNYLFVLLNPLPSSSIPLHPPPFGNHQNAPYIHDSVCYSCLLSLFFRFSC